MDDVFFKKINRDYINLKETLDDHEKIREYFNLDSNFYQDVVDALRVSKEHGYIEAREGFLKKTKAVLDEGKHQALNSYKVDELVDFTTKLLLITVISRKILLGDYILNDKMVQSLEDVKKLDLKTIVSSVTALSVEHPKLSNNRNFKDITLQLLRYNSELKKIGEMVKAISEDKKKQFLENSNKELSIILTSIKKNYHAVLEYITEKENAKKSKESLLARLDFKPALNALYKEQASNYSKLRSSIIYIKQEHYNFQEIIEKTHARLDENISLLHNEEKKILSLLISNKIESSEIDRLISLITDMIIKIIEDYYIEK